MAQAKDKAAGIRAAVDAGERARAKGVRGRAARGGWVAPAALGAGPGE